MVPAAALVGTDGIDGAVLGAFFGVVVGLLAISPSLRHVRTGAVGLFTVAAPLIFWRLSFPAGAAAVLSFAAMAIPAGAWLGALRPSPKEHRKHSSFRLTATSENALDPLLASVAVTALSFALVPPGPGLVFMFGAIWGTALNWSLLEMDKLAGREDSDWLISWGVRAGIATGLLSLLSIVVSVPLSGFGGLLAPRGLIGLTGMSSNVFGWTTQSGTPAGGRDAPDLSSIWPKLLAAIIAVAVLGFLGRLLAPAFGRLAAFLKEFVAQKVEARRIKIREQRILKKMASYSSPFETAAVHDTPAVLLQKWFDAAWLAGYPLAASEGVLSWAARLEQSRLLPRGEARRFGSLFSNLLYGGGAADEEIARAIAALQDAARAGRSTSSLELRAQQCLRMRAVAELDRLNVRGRTLSIKSLLRDETSEFQATSE